MLKRRFWRIILIGCLGFFLSILLLDKGGTNAQTPIFVRENIYTFQQSPIKIAALRRGIQVMQSRPATDPTSWNYQANVHDANNQSNATAWSTCQHGSKFFLSWHRMYLYYFERILRQASGDPNLALPYWNYSDVSAQRVLPSSFRTPANTSNPLYVSQRNSSINNGTALPSRDVSYSQAFTYTNFLSLSGSGQSFGGQNISPTHFGSPHGRLESRPHDQVHVDVGGWMSDPATAALDPIFWLHHANIDRLWERWLQRGGGRANPTQDQQWMNTNFTFFDENGNQVQLTGSQIVNTAQQLNYRYDDNQAQSSSNVNNVAAASQRPVATSQTIGSSTNSQQGLTELGQASLTLTIPLNQQGGLRTAAQSLEQRPLVLNVEGVQYNPKNFIAYEIYLNLPQGVTPNPESPYYVGKLALFAYPQGGTFSIDISPTVRDLQQQNGLSGDSFSVTFVPPAEAITQQRALSATQGGQNVRFRRVTITR